MNPPLDASTNVNGKDIARLVKIIQNGYDERVALDGMYYNNAMTGNPDLKEDAIADVLSYIRNSWSNKAGLVSIADVKKAIIKNKLKKTKVRLEEILKSVSLKSLNNKHSNKAIIIPKKA